MPRRRASVGPYVDLRVTPHDAVHAGDLDDGALALGAHMAHSLLRGHEVGGDAEVERFVELVGGSHFDIGSRTTVGAVDQDIQTAEAAGYLIDDVTIAGFAADVQLQAQVVGSQFSGRFLAVIQIS